MSDILKKLSDEGVSIWLDDISRERLRTGNLEALIRDKHVVGVTSNPTIFSKALSQGSAYDEQVRELTVRGVDVEEASRAITTYDIRWAADVLRPVYDRTEGLDGRVSIEVDPRLAHETEKTTAEPRHCGGSSTGRASTSRSGRRSPACRRSPRRWRRASASASR